MNCMLQNQRGASCRRCLIHGGLLRLGGVIRPDSYENPDGHREVRQPRREYPVRVYPILIIHCVFKELVVLVVLVSSIKSDSWKHALATIQATGSPSARLPSLLVSECQVSHRHQHAGMLTPRIRHHFSSTFFCKPATSTVLP